MACEIRFGVLSGTPRLDFVRLTVSMAASGRSGHESKQWLLRNESETSNNFQALIIKVLMQRGEFMRWKVTTMVFWRQLFESQREALKTETQVCTVACSPRKNRSGMLKTELFL